MQSPAQPTFHPCSPCEPRADAAALTWLAKMRDILVLSRGFLVMWRMSCSMGVIPGTQFAGRPACPRGCPQSPVCGSWTPGLLFSLTVGNCPSFWFSLSHFHMTRRKECWLWLGNWVPCPVLLLSDQGDSGTCLSNSGSSFVKQNSR